MKHLLHRFLAFALMLTILLSAAAFPAAADSRFTDVNQDSWYAEAVEYVSSRGLMNGVAADRFAPNETLNRAMFVTILARFDGAELDNSGAVFGDVPTGKWYTGAVSWAYESGIVNGVSPTEFAPMAYISRQDLCTILARYINSLDLTVPEEEPVTFTDASSIARYAREAVALCARVGLVAGYSDGTFNPKGIATRAQTAVIFMRLDQVLQGLKPDPTPMPAQSFDGSAGEDMSISVNAPEGALPENTDMTVTRVTDEAQLAEIAGKVNGELLAAADISFAKDGAEIEPNAAVEVQISLDGLENVANPAVVHIRDDGSVERVENAELISVTRGPAKVLRFYASDFSVYAVVDQPGEDFAILTVNFYNDYVTEGSDSLIATVYIKNSDDAMDFTDENGYSHYVDLIVYDPGLGRNYDSLPGDVFVGWALNNQNFSADDEGLTIDQIRSYIKTNYTDPDAIPQDGATINLYAMIVKVYTITYLDDKDVSLGGGNVQYLRALATPENPNPAVPYTVNMAFIPSDPEQTFLGWKTRTGTVTRLDGTAYGGDDVIPNETKVLIRSSVVFSVNSPSGHWLVYHENGKGATYNAPIFLVGDAPTVRPATDPIRKGYDFVNWYEAVLNADGTPQKDENGEIVLKSTPYVFGSAITDRVDIYAKWTPKSSAIYTIVIWRQSIVGKNENNQKIYDFAESVQITAAPGAAINTVSGQDSGNSRYARINGNNYQYTGFHLDTYDTENATITVAPEGNTVVNVYYDRNEYTLTFVDNTTGVSYAANSDPTTVSTANIGNAITNNNNINTLNSNQKTVNGFTISRYYNRGWIYAILLNGTWYQISTNGSNVWDAYRVLNANRTSGTVKTITALYQQDISSNFPIVGTNGVTYEQGQRWSPGTNSAGWSQVMIYVPAMEATNCTFTINLKATPLKTMNYYVEALDTDTENIVTRGGVRYKLYASVAARYNGVTEEDFVELTGFEKQVCAETVTGAALSKDSSDFYIYSTTSDQSIYFFYSRNTYGIHFSDGLCVDGEGNRITEEANTGEYTDLAATGIPYESDVGSYNKGGANYAVPTREGYVLEGWYADSACVIPYTFNVMPLNGVTVYAKWRLVQYRTFLVPNAPEGVLIDWGNEDQEMNFRADYGEGISIPIAQDTTNSYEMVGWFLDKNYTKPFNASVFSVNDGNTAPYNKGDDPANTSPVDYTDPMNEYGQITSSNPTNSDAENGRFWITKKLTIYGRWRAILQGADGINVEYVLDEREAAIFEDGQAASEIDDITYSYTDTATALARSAYHPIYTVEDEDGSTFEMRFMHWQIMDWDETQQKWVEAKDEHGVLLTAYPGSNFEVDAKLTRKIPIKDDDGQPTGRNIYTMRLMAVYDNNEQQNPTHITWYGNGGSVNTEMVSLLEETSYHEDVIESNAEQINRPIDILPGEVFINEGRTFLGWARLSEESYVDAQGNCIPAPELTAADVWLEYHPATAANRDGEGEATDAFYTINPAVDDSVPEGSVVSQIAADEHRPYHILYAVWSDDFYVYHSATGKLEAIPLTRADETFDLTARVTDGYYYGGYYTDYAGAIPQNVEAAKHEALLSKSAEGRVAEVANAKLYDAAAFSAEAASGPVLWAKANACGKFTVVVDGEKVEHNDDPGNAIHPKSGMVYYIKEVPAQQGEGEDALPMFLHMHNYYVYNVGGGEITDAYLVSSVDDALYRNVQVVLNMNGTDTALQGRLAKQFTYTRLGENTFDPQDPVTVKVSDAFPAIGRGGYLVVSALPKPADGSDPLGPGSTFTATPSWVTLDGISVTGSSLAAAISADGTIVNASVSEPAGQSVGTAGVHRGPAGTPDGIQSVDNEYEELTVVDVLTLDLPVGTDLSGS